MTKIPTKKQEAVWCAGDFDLTPSERKRCETFGRALYKSLGNVGNAVTPVGARGNLLGAAMAAVGAGVPREVFLSACAEEYDIFDKKKKIKKAVKKKSAKKT